MDRCNSSDGLREYLLPNKIYTLSVEDLSHFPEIAEVHYGNPLLKLLDRYLGYRGKYADNQDLSLPYVKSLSQNILSNLININQANVTLYQNHLSSVYEGTSFEGYLTTNYHPLRGS